MLVSAMLFSAAPARGGEYVVLHHSGVNIRTGPKTTTIVIGEASKGELYHFVDERGSWYVIEMFAGEQRYISKSLSSRLQESHIVQQHYYVLPPEEEKRRDLYKRIHRAKERALREAQEIIPATLDEERHSKYRKILEDRYILKAFQNREVPPGLYRKLIEEAQNNNW
jgi:hypothetical protein